MDFKNENVEIIESLNQRGGKMLRWDYLIKVGTIPESCIDILKNAMENRVSFLIGAKPGAAGKTTIMGALLSLRPKNERLRIFTNSKSIDLEDSEQIICQIVHEIGAGPYYGYVWNDFALEFFEIPEKYINFKIAGNLHCDSINEIIELITSIGGNAKLLKNIQMIIFIEYDRMKKPSRIISEIWKLDHDQIHKRIF